MSKRKGVGESGSLDNPHEGGFRRRSLSQISTNLSDIAHLSVRQSECEKLPMPVFTSYRQLLRSADKRKPDNRLTVRQRSIEAPNFVDSHVTWEIGNLSTENWRAKQLAIDRDLLKSGLPKTVPSARRYFAGKKLSPFTFAPLRESYVIATRRRHLPGRDSGLALNHASDFIEKTNIYCAAVAVFRSPFPLSSRRMYVYRHRRRREIRLKLVRSKTRI